jgi:uncharacterized GH25 family protein
MRSSLLTALLLSVLSSTATAHFPWLDRDAEARVIARFGHGPGADEGLQTLAAERLEALVAVGAEGATLALPLPAGSTAFAAPTAALIAATQKPGYWSRRAQGGERRPRSEVPDALGCVYSRNSMKLALADSPATALSVPLGHPLELLAAGPLRKAAAGAVLPLQLRFSEGAPPTRISVMPMDGHVRPQLIDALGEGRFEVPLPRPGRWLIYARATTPYPDPARCDENGYNSSLVIDLPAP